MGGPVVVGALELQHNIAGTVECQPLVGNGGTGDVAAQVLPLGPWSEADPGVQGRTELVEALPAYSRRRFSDPASCATISAYPRTHFGRYLLVF
jgi:hypothetical protein